MKKLLFLILLLPFFAQGQWVNGTIQRETGTANIRYLQGTNLDSLLDRTTPTYIRTANQGTGTISVTASGTTVTGTGTSFLSDFIVGDLIIANSERRRITAIASNTSMTTNAWTSTFSGAYTLKGGGRFQIRNNGNVSIGKIDSIDTEGPVIDGSAIPLNVANTYLNPGQVIGIRSSPTVKRTVNSAQSQYGMTSSIRIGAGNTANHTESTKGVVGFQPVVLLDQGATGTISTVNGIYVYVGNDANSGGNITNAYGIHSVGVLNSGHGGTTINAAGISVDDQGGATNNTNLLVGTPTIPSGNWNIYSPSSKVNLLGGKLQLGSSTPTAGAPFLDVTGSIGSTSITASRAVVTDANSVLTQSATTATELGYVSGVTSAIQTQLNAKGTGTITALTGDVSASGSGSVAATLATVNSNVGSFGSSTAIPTVTVNAKGLVTAASTSAVVAPASTLSGNTLATGVTISSLTSFGNSPTLVTPNLGTPTTLVGTNITGTASALNIGGTAPAGTLTGSTLASGVTASSLISAGSTFTLASAGSISGYFRAINSTGNVSFGRQGAAGDLLTGSPAGATVINNGDSTNPIYIGINDVVVGHWSTAGITANNLVSGTYTPTLTNTANVTSSTPYVCHYIRVGNEVTVSGYVEAITTTGGSAILGVTLPVASNFTAGEDLAGSGSLNSSVAQNVILNADATNDRAVLILGIPGSLTQAVYFTFKYTVK